MENQDYKTLAGLIFKTSKNGANQERGCVCKESY